MVETQGAPRILPGTGEPGVLGGPSPSSTLQDQAGHLICALVGVAYKQCGQLTSVFPGHPDFKTESPGNPPIQASQDGGLQGRTSNRSAPLPPASPFHTAPAWASMGSPNSTALSRAHQTLDPPSQSAGSQQGRVSCGSSSERRLGTLHTPVASLTLPTPADPAPCTA